MKRKITLLTISLLLFVLFISNAYVKANFHMNFFQYFFSTHQLTSDDRNYLSEHGPIIYASDNNSPPLRFYDKESGQYKGIVIDYLQALSIELGTEIHFVPMVWEDALRALQNGESDICDMYPSKARSEIFLFSDPVYNQRGIILVNKNEQSVKSVVDLKGKTVAVQSGDYVHEFLKNTIDGVNYVFTKDYEESLRLLMGGSVEALVGDEPVISYFLGIYDAADQFEIVDQPLYELPSVLSLSLDDKRLQGIINKGIYALTEKNTINKIQQKWFGISTPIGNNTQKLKITLSFVASISIISLIIILTLFWNLELKKAVETQTKALIVSKNNLLTIIDSLHHLIVVVSNDLQVLTANNLFYDFFKVDPTVESTYLDAVMPGITESVKWHLLSSREVLEQIVKGRTYRLTPYLIEYEEYTNASTLIMIEDVTDRKINEARMLQDNKMAAVGQLATGVAHEIRNPLGLIRNYAFILKRSQGDSTMLTKSLEIIEESVEKASSIIDNLLNFSRLSDDAITTVPLKEFIENVVELNEKLMHQNRLKCQLILEEVTINTHEESLKHILINLMNNAIDAMPKGGQLTIWLNKTSDGPAIHVIDRGMGMSREVLDKLFEPFFTTKKVGEGTGLGLYIVYNELKKMNGSIEVISKVDVGTTFKIKFKKDYEV
ncbi:MAG: transporter substrate-binding domain-containing protein [Clostridia bacterium]|nr:transporter substrate-binding domain-containing protein [Clostridia bacterium]